MLTLPDVHEGIDGSLIAAGGPTEKTFRQASIDSRTVKPDDLFFAVRGERVDGHDFVNDAISAGAAGAVVERPLDIQNNAAMIHVDDSLVALQKLAGYWRHRHDVRIVAVTGSVGKTTCKEMIAAVLSERHNMLKSEANLNTEIGIPLTLLGLSTEHEHAALEFGMYARGDIALLCDLASPQVGVVTNIGPVHLERLGSMGAITAAKAELVESLPKDGLAVLNGDDPRTAALANRTPARAVLYGRSSQCDVRATEIQSHGLDGFTFRLTQGGSAVGVRCPLPGVHNVYPALAAAAVALNDGMTLSEIAAALASSRPDLRLRTVPGPNGSTIIDDSYNASPAAMIAALDLLAELPGRRLALLGEMRELGQAEFESHQRVGERAATACDILYVIGERAAPLAAAASAKGIKIVHSLTSPEAAVGALRSELRQGDYLLVKASRALALETVVEALCQS